MASRKNTQDQLPEPIEPITERELEILQLMADGRTNQNIAEQLVLSLDTVKWYNKRIYGKLFAKNRTEAIKQARTLGLLGGGSAQPQSTKTAEPPRHNLPAATTPFVGREMDLASQAELLAHENIRLVTILAVGGMGKTRLALEAAKTQLTAFPDGVYFFPLAQLRTADNIAPTIAAYLNVQLSSAEDPTTQLVNALGSRKILFVLDNFEHLLSGVDVITALLQGAPNIKIIVTSRERLNLRGETVYTLGGMSLPTNETPAEILACNAAQLFIQRMQLLRPQEEVSHEELLYIRRICQQVGGMPLGIELAASLTDILSPEEITREIAQNFDVLETEMRDMPPRLRSIRAVLDYSWGRLTLAEQDIYMRLTVFPAGFTREAAEAVVGASLRVLRTLTHKSLLQRESAAERYVIHELLRQYAEEKLVVSGQAAAAHQAHAQYYLDLMAQSWQQIKGQHQLEALDQIELDFENIRAAWEWAVTHADFDGVDQALEALYWYCDMRARVPTGEKLFRLAREKFGISFDPEAHPIRRRLLIRFNPTADGYQAQAEQALAVARQLNHPDEMAFFLWILGYGRFFSGQFAQAIPILEEAMTLFKMLSDDFYVAESMHWLGTCHRFLGRLEEALAYAEEIRAVSERSGNKFALARILGNLGIYGVFLDAADARDRLQKAIAIRDEISSQSGIAISLFGLGVDAFLQGDFSQAREFAEDSFTRAADSNSLFPKACALGLFGWLAVIEERYDEAWRFCEESQAVSTNPNVLMFIRLGFAMSACGLEQYTAACDHLRHWLQFTRPLHTPRGFLSALSIMAIINAGQGEAQQAVEVLALIFTHPKSPTGWLEKWELLKRWQNKLEAALGEESYRAAWERGTSLTIEAVIQTFLEAED